ncbi:MAG: 6,7-dimethyl-8-ribityllumazine synthase, partial [Oscillospiraceae bacterium]|nr:6,7-dimethyl-8-ribityllumazine synthase [Oscillospiraceae bacterium]
MNTFEGKLISNNDIRVGVVASRFNEFIVSKLVSGCEDGLLRHGVQGENIDLAW